MPSKVYTLEHLKSMNIEQRGNIYINAKKIPEGKYIVDLIDSNGLALSSGGLTMDDPVYLTIVDTAWSNEGKMAAIQATDEGWPAVSGVDRLLQAKLGDRYGKHDMGTVSAGSVVGEVMRHLGYKKGGQKACPPDCVAKTGAIWIKNVPLS